MMDGYGSNLRALTVVPSDTADLVDACRAIYVGGGPGDVKVTMLGGQTVVFKAVPTGTILPVRCSRIFSTGTTATLLIALW